MRTRRLGFCVPRLTLLPQLVKPMSLLPPSSIGSLSLVGGGGEVAEPGGTKESARTMLAPSGPVTATMSSERANAKPSRALTLAITPGFDSTTRVGSSSGVAFTETFGFVVGAVVVETPDVPETSSAVCARCTGCHVVGDSYSEGDGGAVPVESSLTD